MGDDIASEEGHVYLHGLRLGYYRGIGEPQDIAPFRKLNFFVGANNSGKSSVLRFLHDYGELFGMPPYNRDRSTKPGDRTGERFIGDLEQTCIYDRGFSTKRTKSHILHGTKRSGLYEGFINFMAKTVVSDGKGGTRHTVWTKNVTERDMQFDAKELSASELDGVGRFSSFLGRVNPRDPAKSIGICRDFIAEKEDSLSTIPTVRTIPAFRAVSGDQPVSDERVIGGTNLIATLFRFQVHDIGEEQNREKFDKLTKLVQDVLQKPKAQIQIPAKADKIIVEMDDKRLPLAELGTGIEEVIMIGAYCTIHDAEIICIEEPEIHLHPVLQRRLIEYLQRNTANQYFIATHSAALMDTRGAAVFHVSNDGEATTVTPVDTRASRRLLTDELGYRPSDIVQSNSVIWVEGPSDRLYLLNWLEQKDEGLIEGVHFSIMFYGGRLLSHLTADAEKLDEFINLKSLNQHSAILIDSDKENARKRINQTKTRIRDEFAENGGFAWVTKGREVENYLDPERLAEAVKSVHPQKLGTLGDMGDFDNRLVFTHAASGKPTTADKVKVAELMCREPLDLTVLDLEPRLNDLVKFIKDANGMR